MTSSRIAFYEKNGTLLGARRGVQNQLLRLRNPIPALAFFEPLIEPMNQTLNLQPEAASLLKADGTLLYGIDEVYDLRVTFDAYRRRFWIVGLARNSNADTDNLEQNVYRRTKFVVAVSQTEDPRDGSLGKSGMRSQTMEGAGTPAGARGSTTTPAPQLTIHQSAFPTSCCCSPRRQASMGNLPRRACRTNRRPGTLPRLRNRCR